MATQPKPDLLDRPGGRQTVSSAVADLRRELVAAVDGDRIRRLVDVLYKIAVDPLENPKNRIAATREILHHTIGKPAQMSAEEGQVNEYKIVIADNNTAMRKLAERKAKTNGRHVG